MRAAVLSALALVGVGGVLSAVGAFEHMDGWAAAVAGAAVAVVTYSIVRARDAR